MEVNFDKSETGLVPAIVQDARTGKVLMLGFMNKAALEQTRATGKVTFFSRSKQRLWVKGETSGNFLRLEGIKVDCDKDSLLISAIPDGPTCHTGSDTCWGEVNQPEPTFLDQLESVISSRRHDLENQQSYVASLFRSGINKIAQKVGEEAVEVVIEAKDDNQELFLEEAADLLFHYLILLQAKGSRLQDVLRVLEGRK